MEKEQQDFIINALLDTLCNIQETLEPVGLRANEIQWCNDLYDEVHVNYFKCEEIDGTYQEELAEIGDTWDYKTTYEAIMCRINGLIQI